MVTFIEFWRSVAIHPKVMEEIQKKEKFEIMEIPPLTKDIEMKVWNLINTHVCELMLKIDLKSID